MSEVRYSVNGKYFKDFGICVSDSDGLFDALKRKPVNTYDWAEYHGSSPDLSNPKFEQREITLKAFVTGANWETMKSNFDAIVSEFQKAGTQRLLIEPFGLKSLPYEVCMIDEVKLQKEFKNGQMVGTFTLKLIEPNPIKKVLYLTGNSLNLSYNSSKETEIFYGNGVKDVVAGNASFSNKTLANRAVSGYNFEGRNLLLNSKHWNYEDWWSYDGGQQIVEAGIGGMLLTKTGVTIIDNKVIPNKTSENMIVGQVYTLSFEYFGTTPFQVSVGTQLYKNENPTALGKGVFTFTFTYTEALNGYLYITNILDNTSVIVKNLKLEKGDRATKYSPAPEDEKFIIIAGNVEEITNLTTNAEVLWERL